MPALTTRYAMPTDNLAVTASNATVSICTVSPKQVAGYPQTNLLVDDRYTVWRCPASPGVSTVNVDIDLGFAQSITLVGLLNFQLAGGTYPLFASWWASADKTTWANLVNWVQFSLSYTDILKVVVPLPTRYFRCQFQTTTATHGFSVGKVFLGNYSDLGLVYAPGSTESLVAQRSRVRLLDGREVVTELGPTRRGYKMLFPTCNADLRTILLSLATSLKPFTLIAADGTASECRAVGDVMESNARWGVSGSAGSDLWDCTLEVESLT